MTENIISLVLIGGSCVFWFCMERRAEKRRKEAEKKLKEIRRITSEINASAKEIEHLFEKAKKEHDIMWGGLVNFQEKKGKALLPEKTKSHKILTSSSFQ